MSSSQSVNNQICNAEGCFAAAEEIKASERSFFNRHLLSKSKLGLIIKNSSLCEVEDNILLSRLKLVGASPRGGTWREAGSLEICPHVSDGESNRFLSKHPLTKEVLRG